MKTKQTKINRSGAALLPGAMALAATTASSQAATVQITLAGNKVSSTGGNQLNADLTGDGVGDLTLNGAVATNGVGVVVNGLPAWLQLRAGFTYETVGFTYSGNPQITAMYQVQAGFDNDGVGSFFKKSGGVVSLTYLNPITFQDSRINGGAVNEAWLEVHAFNTSKTEHTVEFTRLIFDDSSTTRPVFNEIPSVQTGWVAPAVPEPSSFGMLALGAGGLLARRRRAKQAA